MTAVTLADLLFRARQFLIAIIGVSLVLAMALLLTGLAYGFTYEVDQTVGGLGADHLILADGAHGRLTAVAVFPQADVGLVRRQAGITQAQPLVMLPAQTTQVKGTTVTVNVAGVIPGRLGSPTVAAGNGHPLTGRGQAVVDTRLGAPVGSTVVLGGRPFSVVGTVTDRTLLGGVPIVYLTLPDAQSAALEGRPLISAILTTGSSPRTPGGLQTLTTRQVTDATLGQVHEAASSITNSTILMWVIAAFIVAALLYVAALERRRDFAVLKALGASSADLFGSLMVEAVVVTLVAAAIAEVISNGLKFIFKQPVIIQGSAYLELPLIAIVVGLLASLVALRRATGADPASAFG